MSIPAKVKSALTKRAAQINDAKTDFIIHFIVVRPAALNDDPLLLLTPKAEGTTLAAFREQYKTHPAVAKATPSRMIFIRGVIQQSEGDLRIYPAPESKFTASTQVKKGFTDLKEGLTQASVPATWINRLEQAKARVMPPVDPRKIGEGVPDPEDLPTTTATERLTLPVREAPDLRGLSELEGQTEEPDAVGLLAVRFKVLRVVDVASSLQSATEDVKEQVKIAARARLISLVEDKLRPLLLQAEKLREAAQRIDAPLALSQRAGDLGRLIILMEQSLTFAEDVIDRTEAALTPPTTEVPDGGVDQVLDPSSVDPILVALVEAVKKVNFTDARDTFHQAFHTQPEPAPSAKARARVRLVGARNALQKIALSLSKHIADLRSERDGTTRNARKLSRADELMQRIEGLVLECEEELGAITDETTPPAFDMNNLGAGSVPFVDEARFAPVKTLFTEIHRADAALRALLKEEDTPRARTDLAKSLASAEPEHLRSAQARIRRLTEARDQLSHAVAPLPVPTNADTEAWLATQDLAAQGDPRTDQERIDQDYVPRRVNNYALFRKSIFDAKKSATALTDKATELVQGAEAFRLYRDLGQTPRKSDARAMVVQTALDNPAALRSMARSATGARMLDELVAGLGEKVKTEDLPFLKAAFAARFDMDIGGTDLTRRATPQMYKLFAMVPEAHARDNPAIKSVMRTRKASGGGDYGNKNINIEVRRSGFSAPTVKIKVSPRQEKKANFFNHTVLHEIGHGVDEDMKFMDTRMSEALFGTWVSTTPQTIAARLYDENQTDPVLKSLDADAVKAYFQALLTGTAEAPKTTADPTHLPTLLKGHALTEVCKLIAPTDNKGLWFAGEAATAKVSKALGGQVAVHSYAAKWHLYDGDARDRMVRDYQFRAPGEWFAEIYAAYYMGLLNATDKAWFEKEIHNPAQGQG